MDAKNFNKTDQYEKQKPLKSLHCHVVDKILWCELGIMKTPHTELMSKRMKFGNSKKCCIAVVQKNAFQIIAITGQTKFWVYIETRKWNPWNLNSKLIFRHWAFQGTMRMFFGMMSSRNSGVSCWRRQRIRKALATAFLVQTIIMKKQHNQTRIISILNRINYCKFDDLRFAMEMFFLKDCIQSTRKQWGKTKINTRNQLFVSTGLNKMHHLA